MDRALNKRDKNMARTPHALDQQYGFQGTKKEIVVVKEKVEEQEKAIDIQSTITEIFGTIIEEIVANKADKSQIRIINYDLNEYKVNNLTIVRSSCAVKNNRAIISCVATINGSADTDTTIFDLPEDLRPSDTKDFILYCADDTSSYIGYGILLNNGIVKVRFPQNITSIRFSFAYDLDDNYEEEEV